MVLALQWLASPLGLSTFFQGVVNLERMFETPERIFVVMEKLKGGTSFVNLSLFSFFFHLPLQLFV